MRAKRDDTGLTPQQEKFASLLAQGRSQSDCYRAAYNSNGAKPATIWSEGSRLAHDPKVSARVGALLEDARLEDLDDCRRALLDLLHDLDSARQAGNWSAVAAMTRLRLQAHGMLKDKLVVSDDIEGWSDERLVTELAGHDPEKRRLVADLIGADSEDDG